MKILVVEDQPVELKLAVLVLKAAGHEADGAIAAEQALDAIREDRPDVLLLDLSLPGMDGLALARKLKADPATREIQIVAVTSWPDRFTKADARDAGCDAYLEKPLSTRLLPQALMDIVRNSEGESSS